MTNTLAAANQPQSFDVNANPQGDWSVEIPTAVSPGPHIVTIKDEQGNESQVLMYIVGGQGATATTTNQPSTAAPSPQPEIFTRVITALPPFFNYFLVILFLIFVILSANMVRLARKADKENHQQKKKYTTGALIVCALALIATLVIGLTMNNKIKININVSNAQVSGQLINPITQQGVKGVDLVSGNTTVRTMDSGQYIFGAVNVAEGIKATEPNLLKSLIFLPSDKDAQQTIDIYFDTEMFNQLTRVVDLESRGKFIDVYNLLAPSIKDKVSADAYAKSATTNFTPANISDQQLTIVKTELFDKYNKYDLTFNKVVKISVLANGQITGYYLVKPADSGWQLIK